MKETRSSNRIEISGKIINENGMVEFGEFWPILLTTPQVGISFSFTPFTSRQFKKYLDPLYDIY